MVAVVVYLLLLMDNVLNLWCSRALCQVNSSHSSLYHMGRIRLLDIRIPFLRLRPILRFQPVPFCIKRQDGLVRYDLQSRNLPASWLSG